MDKGRFDQLTKHIFAPASRRASVRSLGGGLGAALSLLGLTGAGAGKKKGKGKKKKKNKKKCSGFRKCGKNCCPKGTFCCDDARKICCNDGDSCCNIGPGTGSCCAAPNQCGKPWGNDAAPFECCPPERQWFTGAGLIRCCPPGTRSLGTEISSDDGPCCPEEKYCSNALTGGKCCPDVAPICLDRATGQCCNEEARCGTNCCSGEFGDCCAGECRLTELGPWTDCGSFCCQSAAPACCAATGGGSGVCCNPSTHVCTSPCGALTAACCPIANPNCCGG